MPKQPRFWIGSFPRGPSRVVDDLQTLCLTRSVDWRSVESVSWNVWLASPTSTPPSPSGRRAYRALLRRKREAFWTSKVESERSSPQQLWRSIDELMGRSRVLPSEDIGATEFHRYFDAEVADVRTLTDSASRPSFFSTLCGCTFVNFRSLTIDDVAAAIRLLPDKACVSDPIPTVLLKDCADVITPFLVELYNKSLQTGSVPALFKAAYITPLLKKSDLDSADVRSYRPISNFPFCPSCWNALSLDSFWIILQRQNFCLNCSRLTGRTTPQKLQSSRFWQISCLRWIPAT